MLALFETPAGYALFKVLDNSAINDLSTDLESESTIKRLVQLKAFHRFTNTTTALAAATALVEGKPTKDLRKFLKNNLSADDQLIVGDSKLGAAIRKKTGLQCVSSQTASDLVRGIRTNVDALMNDDNDVSGGQEMRKAMVLGLAHSLSRYKLKFSPDKVDTMIVQAISLLDELEKEINIYAMRLREWYGWHFPEMGKIVAENDVYAKVIKAMGMRSQAANTDLTEILSDELAEDLKQAAKVSMGTEISDEDVLNIRALCDQVISLSHYRATLLEYLKNRMSAIAPNLTAMVGELVGARLISRAGSLVNLAKYPASTVQILGAEKALFRALKTKHATPKYGLIYHASVVGQAAAKHKGKISRSLAAKCALAIRVDALGDSDNNATVGKQGRLAIENRLSQLEGKTEFSISKLGSREQMSSRSMPRGGSSYSGVKDMELKVDNRMEVEKDGEEAGSGSNNSKAKGIENLLSNGRSKDESVVDSEKQSSSKKSKSSKKDKSKKRSGEKKKDGEGTPVKKKHKNKMSM